MPPAELSDDRDSWLQDALTRLEAQRHELRARLVLLDQDMVGFIEASRDSNADDEHDPEGQTIAFERAQLGFVTNQLREHVAEIDATIGRVGDATYGICEVCAQPINAERLEVRPTARACVAHVPSTPSRAVTVESPLGS